MKYILSLFLAVGFATVGFAQKSSDAILKTLSEKAKGYKTITADYESRLVDKPADIDISDGGKASVAGDKFRLELKDFTIISDGENVWTYDKGNNEVYIDYAEEMDMGGMKPADMFTIWETGFKHEWKETVTMDGKSLELIYLYPTDAGDKPFHTVQLYVNDKTKEVHQFIVKGKEGNDTTYKIKNFKTNMEIATDTFMFKEADFPGVEVIDQR